MVEAAAEKVFYDRDGVRVTNARFQVGAQTYAMSAVNSVAYQREEAGHGFAIFLGFVGAAMLLVGGVGVKLSTTVVVSVALAVVGVLLLATGIWLAKSAKPTYLVALTTASGQVKALSSMEAGAIEPVVRALNDALVSRG